MTTDNMSMPVAAQLQNIARNVRPAPSARNTNGATAAISKNGKNGPSPSCGVDNVQTTKAMPMALRMPTDSTLRTGIVHNLNPVLTQTRASARQR